MSKPGVEPFPMMTSLCCTHCGPSAEPRRRRIPPRRLTPLRCLYTSNRKIWLINCTVKRVIMTEWTSEDKEYRSLPQWPEPLAGASRTLVLLPNLRMWGDTGCPNPVQRDLEKGLQSQRMTPQAQMRPTVTQRRIYSLPLALRSTGRHIF